MPKPPPPVICLKRDENFGRTCIRSYPNEIDEWCEECRERQTSRMGSYYQLTDRRMSQIIVAFRGQRHGKTLAQELINEVFRLRQVNKQLADNRRESVCEEIRLRSGLCDFCRCALLHQPDPEGQACRCGKR